MLRGLGIAVLIACAAPMSAAAQDFFTLKGHGGPIMAIAVSPAGRVATASFDNSVGLWTGLTPRWFEGHRAAVNAVVFVTEDTGVSAGDDFALRLWNDGDGTMRELGQHKGKVAALAVSPGKDMVASASWDGTIGLWPLAPDGGAPRFLAAHEQGVNDVAFTQDGATLYSASIDGTIRVWDVATGREMQVLVNHGFGVNELELNEDAGWLAYGAVDGATRIIDLRSGVEIANFTLDRRPILALAFHPPSQTLAVGDGQGYIMVIDTDARAITRDFRATSQGPIWALAFSPDGHTIHAGGIEDIVYSWPVASMDEHGPMAVSVRQFLEDPATMDNGERQFKRKCSICHALAPGNARRAGPTLHGLFGRRAGTVPGYAYSDVLAGSEIVWSAQTINALFDEGPDHYVPGTKMPMQRIARKGDRDDLIDYLRTATTLGEN